MSKRKDRERAQNGQLFRNGNYVSKEDFLEELRKAKEEALAKAEKAKKDLAAVGKWLKKADEEQALKAIIKK